jgi:hypothetical protein
MMQLELRIPAPAPKHMPEKAKAVLELLRKKGARGVTWDDVPKGFAIRSRIADLRKAGHLITTIDEKLEGGTIRARYVLLQG